MHGPHEASSFSYMLAILRHFVFSEMLYHRQAPSTALALELLNKLYLWAAGSRLWIPTDHLQ